MPEMDPATKRSPYYRAWYKKPWEGQLMDEAEYGHLLAFVAANPLLVHKLIWRAGMAIEKQRAKESEADNDAPTE